MSSEMLTHAFSYLKEFCINSLFLTLFLIFIHCVAFSFFKFREILDLLFGVFESLVTGQPEKSRQTEKQLNYEKIFSYLVLY